MRTNNLPYKFLISIFRYFMPIICARVYVVGGNCADDFLYIISQEECLVLWRSRNFECCAAPSQLHPDWLPVIRWLVVVWFRRNSFKNSGWRKAQFFQSHTSTGINIFIREGVLLVSWILLASVSVILPCQMEVGRLIKK